MKMTTEQFLSHLGIEVGKPFNVKGYEQWQFRVVGDIVYGDVKEHTFFEFPCDVLSWLLNKEITPLPKYTLTEDEKAIVRHAPKEADDILNQLDGSGLAFITKNSSVIDLPLVELFKFIQIGKYVSLDELRKCL